MLNCNWSLIEFFLYCILSLIKYFSFYYIFNRSIYWFELKTSMFSLTVIHPKHFFLRLHIIDSNRAKFRFLLLRALIESEFKDTITFIHFVFHEYHKLSFDWKGNFIKVFSIILLILRTWFALKFWLLLSKKIYKHLKFYFINIPLNLV